MKKIILLLASYVLFLTTASSQEIEWQNTIGGDEDDYLNIIRQTQDGGYMMAGYSSSNISGDKTENSNGDDDYWIIKTDSAGNIQWQNTIGGSGYDWLYTAEQTSDGGYILGGYSESNISGDKTENSNGAEDYWIVKVDATGNIQWQNTIGGSYNDKLSSVKQTSDGGYILGGSSISPISGDKTENPLGAADFWVVKTNSSGIIQWQNTIGGSDFDELYSIQQTSDGGYICGGYSDSPVSGDKTENCIGLSDFWIVKLTPSGSIQWQNDIGGNQYEYLNAISQTADGGYICAGWSESNISGDKTESCKGSDDYWIIKLSASGGIQWQNTIGGSSYDSPNNVRQTADGGYIIAGSSSSPISGDKTEITKGSDDYWIVKLDGSGNVQWQKSIGGSKNNFLISASQTSDGGYILGGISDSDFSGDKTENSLGGSDYWIVKLDDKFNSITGKLFIDLNSNGVRDAGEPAAANKAVTELNTGRFNFSYKNGYYFVTVLDSGNFSVSPETIDYYSFTPAVRNVYFPGMQQTDSLNNFAFQPAGVFNDLCVVITPMATFRPGFDASYMISYENTGTTALSGTIILFPDNNNMIFLSSNPAPTTVTADSIVWNTGILTPFQPASIIVNVQVNSGTSIGTLMESEVRIEPVAGDANPACNYDTSSVYASGSFDPNAILVDRDTVLTTELSSPPYLNYIIYFQNTGNDTAFDIRVLTNIPQTLDVNSFEFVASSHPVNFNYAAPSRLFTFIFNNINLPDTATNEPASHGFVRYRIKPLSTLIAGDSIKKNAAIYFDFNDPVLTNTAVTEIVLPTGISSLTLPEGKGITLAPNPASHLLAVTFTPPLQKGRAGLQIFDLLGQEVYHSAINNQLPKNSYGQSTIKIDVSTFPEGVYLIQMRSDEETLRAKFLKQ